MCADESDGQPTLDISGRNDVLRATLEVHFAAKGAERGREPFGCGAVLGRFFAGVTRLGEMIDPASEARFGNGQKAGAKLLVKGRRVELMRMQQFHGGNLAGLFSLCAAKWPL